VLANRDGHKICLGQSDLIALRVKALEIAAKLLIVVKFQLVATGHLKWVFGEWRYHCATIPYHHFRIQFSHISLSTWL